MSRTMDEQLAGRIVEKAHQLWSKSGEDAVTLRAVARAAGTTTPTVYARFPTKEDLIAAVADRVRLEMAQALMSSRNARAACDAYLEIAARRQREYGLVFGSAWGKLFRQGRPRPAVDWTKQQLAREHGGDPERYDLSAHALWYLLHGAASILQHLPAGPAAEEVKQRCVQACDAIIARPLGLKKKRKK